MCVCAHVYKRIQQPLPLYLFFLLGLFRMFYQWKCAQLTTTDANTIFWIYRSIKAMLLQIWIDIGIGAAYETWRSMTLPVEF